MCVLRETRFYQKAQNSIFSLETRFFPHETRWILEKNLSGVTLFKPFLLTKCLEKSKNLQFFKKIVLKNSETRFQKGETRFQNAETRFQNAETRFQNAKTALSRIFFARTGMDSAQKKPAWHK